MVEDKVTIEKFRKAKEMFELREHAESLYDLRQWRETVVALKFYYGWIP